MEKTYFYATIFFGWLITLALIIFIVVAFKMSMIVIGCILILISLASLLMNIVFMKKGVRNQQQ